MLDDYSYFCIPIMLSLQNPPAHVDVHTQTHTHQSHLKYLQVRIRGVNQMYKMLSCGGGKKMFWSQVRSRQL